MDERGYDYDPSYPLASDPMDTWCFLCHLPVTTDQPIKIIDALRRWDAMTGQWRTVVAHRACSDQPLPIRLQPGQKPKPAEVNTCCP